MRTSTDYSKWAEKKRKRDMSCDELGDNLAHIVIGALICAVLWWYDVAVWTGVGE